MNHDHAARHRKNAFQILSNSSYFSSETEGFDWVMQCVDAGVAQAGQPVIFRHLRDEGRQQVYEVGHYGGDTQVVKTTQRSIWWLWAAIDDRQRTNTLRARDFSAPWATTSDDSTRKALRNGTSKELKKWGMRELDAVAKHITVVDGVISYDPPASAVKVITR